jgi:hypothetical protein
VISQLSFHEMKFAPSSAGLALSSQNNQVDFGDGSYHLD